MTWYIASRDRDRAIRTIIGEAGNQGIAGQRAVAHVLMNRTFTRVQSDGTIYGTIMRPGAFSYWNDETGYARGRGGYSTRHNISDAQYERVGRVWDDVVAGNQPDNTGGSTHYYNPNDAAPRWGTGHPQWNEYGMIGAHRFGTAGRQPYAGDNPNDPRAGWVYDPGGLQEPGAQPERWPMGPRNPVTTPDPVDVSSGAWRRENYQREQQRAWDWGDERENPGTGHNLLDGGPGNRSAAQTRVPSSRFGMDADPNDPMAPGSGAPGTTQPGYPNAAAGDPTPTPGEVPGEPPGTIEPDAGQIDTLPSDPAGNVSLGTPTPSSGPMGQATNVPVAIVTAARQEATAAVNAAQRLAQAAQLAQRSQNQAQQGMFSSLLGWLNEGVTRLAIYAIGFVLLVAALIYFVRSGTSVQNPITK